MPPKKKSPKKKSGKKSGFSKGPTVIDGVPVSEMNKEQLEGHVKRLLIELQKEREERNFYQLERDRVTVFWEVTKKHLDECRAELRIKDREIEEAEDRHQTEINVYKQKVKHLLYEQEHNLAELKAENMICLKVSKEEHQRIEHEHLKDIMRLQDEIREKNKQYTEVLNDSKLRQAEEIEKLYANFEEKVRAIEKRYSDRFVSLRSEMQLRFKSEMSDMEERKNSLIENLRRKNDKSMVEMKNYYNDITLNNLAMISTLKEQLKSKEEKLERNEQLLSATQQENRKLAEPLQKTKEELNELQKQIGMQENEKEALAVNRSKLKTTQKELEDAKWELEILKQKYDKTLKERDEIHEKFCTSILELNQKSSLKYTVLEHQISELKEELAIKEAQIHTIVSKGKNDMKKDKEKGTQILMINARDVVHEQEYRIKKLEREILMMRHKKQSQNNFRIQEPSLSSNTDQGGQNLTEPFSQSNNLGETLSTASELGEFGSISSSRSSSFT